MMALLLGAATPPPSLPAPEPALREAQALTARGDTAGALRVLEKTLARLPARGDEANATALHLEAARTAANANETARAKAHLDAFERLSPVFGSAPTLLARLRREAARVATRLGNPQAAERLLSKTVVILAASDAAVAAEAANALGLAQLDLHYYQTAEASFTWSLSLLEGAPAPEELRVTVLVNLSSTLIEASRINEARAMVRRAEEAAGTNPRWRNEVALVKAQILLRDSDIPGAKQLLESSARDASVDDPSRPHMLLLLATAHFNSGFMPEAIRAGLEAAEAYRVTLGSRHPALARTYHLLGTAYADLKSLARAGEFFVRATDIERASFGDRSVQLQSTELERAWLDVQTDELANAAQRAERALIVLKQANGVDHRLEGIANVILGLVAEKRRDNNRAVDRYRTAQRLVTEARGERSPDLGFSLVRLGRLFTRLRRYDEAQSALDRAVAIYEHAGSAGTPRLAEAMMARADLLAARGDRRGSIDESRRGYAILTEAIGRNEGGAESGDQLRHGVRELFAVHATRVLMLESGSEAVEEAFSASQYALVSRAGQALRMAAARRAERDDELGGLLRRREDDDASRRQAGEQSQAAMLGRGPDSVAEQERLRSRERDYADRVRGADIILARRFPGYDQFSRPRPVSIAAVRAALRPHEMLLMPVTTEDITLVWAVTDRDARAVPVPVGRRQIAKLVGQIRKGVDLGAVPNNQSLPLFDTQAASDLYSWLITPVSAVIGARTTLVVVTDGSLQTVPFTLLIGGSARDWLVRSYAVSNYPSVEALVATRSARVHSAAPMSFLGIGNPRLQGYAVASDATRSVAFDLRDALSRLPQLPETADELSRMAALFPDDRVKLLTGEAATGQRLRDGKPNQFRILAFATHAVMAGELPDLTEPAIVLTPEHDGDRHGVSKAGTEGLLTASEIASLELDAELVVLSACNTAAPDGGPLADGFSGLARAFIQAGARSLLVSNWAVSSAATVELTTNFLAALEANPTADKPAALRTAILRLMDNPDPDLRNPAFWAPFVIVGD